MLHNHPVCKIKTGVLEQSKRGRYHFARWTAILSIGVIAALLGVITASADDEGKPAAFSYQVNEDGEISVVYGADRAISTIEDLVEVPLGIPEDAAPAFSPEAGYDIDYVIVVRKDNKLVYLYRCHCHSTGICHCH